MRYFVTLAAREIQVDVTSHPDGGLRVLVDGKPIEVDAVSAGDALSVRVDGRVIDLMLDGAPPKMDFVTFGLSGRSHIETERTRALSRRSATAASGAREALTAPMPGRIVRVVVSPGDRLDAGAPIAVIEAMKMENELRAPHAVTVAEVLVRGGDAVESGAKLVLF